MVEQRSPKPLVEVRFLVGPQTKQFTRRLQTAGEAFNRVLLRTLEDE